MSEILCIQCDGVAEPVRERRIVAYGRRNIVIDDEFMRCSACGETFYAAGQMDATDRRAAEGVRFAHEAPLPFELRNLRGRLL